MKKVINIKERRILEGLTYRIYLFFFYEGDREYTLIKHWDETRRERQQRLNNREIQYPSVRGDY